MTDLPRRLTSVAAELLGAFRVVVVTGPRQAGKSTLVRHVRGDTLVTLDDPSFLERAVEDPIGFVSDLPRSSAIDEFQRAGNGLLRAVKARVDLDSAAGQFLLAGSTQFLAMRSIDETLTGRAGFLELLPLSVGEATGVDETFVERCFTGPDAVPGGDRLQRRDYAELIVRGGFPEVALGPSTQRFRSAWSESYLRTVTAAAHVGQVAEVRRPEALLTLLTQLAARTSGELVVTDLARDTLLDPATVGNYLDVLGVLFLHRPLPAWTTSHTTRAKRRPTIHLVDTALAAHLIGVGADDLAAIDSRWIGPLLESFVVGEVAKQCSWSERPVRLGHYRDRDGREVDLILERGQDIVAVEVKATATPSLSHARHLAFLRDRLGERFRCGIVLHTGTQSIGLGDRLIARPVSSLWA